MEFAREEGQGVSRDACGQGWEKCQKYLGLLLAELGSQVS